VGDKSECFHELQLAAATRKKIIRIKLRKEFDLKVSLFSLSQKSRSFYLTVSRRFEPIWRVRICWISRAKSAKTKVMNGNGFMSWGSYIRFEKRRKKMRRAGDEYSL